MKLFFQNLLLILCVNYSIAQTFYAVEYDAIYNTDFPLMRPALLQFDDNHSVFMEFKKETRDINSTVTIEKTYQEMLDSSLEEEFKDAEHLVVTIQSKYDDVFKNNRSENKFLYTSEITSKRFLIEDNLIQNWLITNETKIVSGYTVVKATTKFRGRNWIAWFAPELAFGYGPWKFRGLPGIILEVFDESNRYHYVAKRITASEKIIIPDVSNAKKITIKDFVAKKDEYLDNRGATSSDRNSQTIRKTFKRNSLETYYEWEEEARK